ncbi:MAG: hypothetical protein HOK35_10210 [Cytophagia bacterium]|nr:hypothetical protein [Cytophagia bacterium]
MIYKLDNLLQEFIKIDDSFEEDGIHYDNIYFTRTESQTCNYVFHSFPEKESSYDDVYYHHFQSIIDISRFLYIQYMLINNLIEYSTFIVKHYYDLISYTPSVNSPNTELFQEEQSIVPFTSFELKDFKKKEKILLKVFQKLIDLNYIIAEKESLNDQTSFLEIFSGLKKTKHVIWNKSAESLHVFIDLLIDKHSLVENCNRWMIAENCFRPEKGSFNSVKLSRISRKPALSHLRNFKKVITLFN